MSDGLVTIAVAGDAEEADRSCARWRSGHRRHGSKAPRACWADAPDGPCRILVESELVGAAQAALLDEDDDSDDEY